MRLIGYDSDYSYIQPSLRKSKISRLMRIYNRDKGVCQLCMTHCRFESATKDHIIPKAHGGKNSIVNLQLAHVWCNGIKGDDNVIHPCEYYIKHPLYGLRNGINKSRGVIYDKGSKYGIPVEALRD